MPKIGMEPLRRFQIIRAVVESVADQGLEALTMEMVAKKANVSKGVVNYYFAGKRDMLLQSFDAFLESYYQQIAELIEPDTTAGEMLEIVFAVCFPDKDVALPLWKYDPKIDTDNLPDIRNAPTYSIGRLGKVLVHFLSKTILDDAFQSIYQKVYNAYLEGMKVIIQHGVASGEFREVDHEKTALSIMALIEGMVLYRNVGFHPLTPQGYRGLCLQFALQFLTKSGSK